MKQALWIANSAIVGVLILSLIILQVLYKEPPQVVLLSAPKQGAAQAQRVIFPSTHWEPIFKHDLFGTYVPRVNQPVQKSLVTPVPQINEPASLPVPEAQKPEFSAELVLTIKGIILGADETQNVALIEDESKKEGLYHVGDLYKDGQIIKISRNSVVFLRSSGQQETFYLRKEDADLAMDGPTKWEYIIKQLEPNVWQIDPESFKHEIDSLGLFLSKTSIIGTAYQQGNPIGVRVGELPENSLGGLLGLEKGDIIQSINNLSVAQASDRVTIFDKITQSKPGESVVVVIKRDGTTIQNTYKLNYISKAKKMLFSDNKDKAAAQDSELKMNKMQEREKQTREFNERHDNNNQQRDAIAQIRQRLLDNLRARLQGARAIH